MLLEVKISVSQIIIGVSVHVIRGLSPSPVRSSALKGLNILTQN